MPEVLCWPADHPVPRAVHASYLELLADRFGEEVGKLSREFPNEGARLRQLLERVPDAALMRFLTAPETSCRLLWAARHVPKDNAGFYQDSLVAELARSGMTAMPTPARDLWTALGDFHLDGDGRCISAPALPGLMPLDFASPYACSLDLGGRPESTPVLRAGLDRSQTELVIERVKAACAGIALVSESVLGFVVTFTKVLIAQPDPEAPTLFASGSSGQYIGRSVLSNPHLSRVDDVEMAEALLHEAIHSLLYMQERRRDWVDPSLYGPQIRTRSPWTGNPLPLRPYLQACFVWYGLLHFWANAVDRGAFDVARVRERIVQCASGFLDEAFATPFQVYREQIAPELLDSINQMRERVNACAADTLGRSAHAH